jgi:hypothetical protein
MTRELVTSVSGRWVVVREGRTLHCLGADMREKHELAHDDSELVFVRSPDVLIEIARAGDMTHVVLHEPPTLEAVARLELDVSTRLAAVTGSRLALRAPDSRHAAIVRVAPRALAHQAIDVGAQFEFVVGLDRDQLLFGLAKELKVWDAVSARPLVKLQLPLPPPPRTVGIAAGHVWATRPDSEEVFVYRLSDGRPFQHRAGAPVERVISHPASPILVLETPRGLVRLHCLAHTVSALDRAPWQATRPPMPLAQLAITPDDVSLLGLPDGSTQPWRMPIGAAATTARSEPTVMATPTPHEAPKPAPAPPPVFAEPKPPARTVDWRDALSLFGEQLGSGSTRAVTPKLADDAPIALLATRLGLGDRARRAMLAFYALYLVGEPAMAISRLAHALGDWSEPLGQGELGALAMLRRKHGRVTLRAAVTDLLDGAPPRAVRLVGDAPQTPRAGAFRVSRDGRADAEIEAELLSKLGRIGVVQGSLSRALLETRLHGATAVAMTAPGERPTRWPQGAGLVLVLYGAATAWVADVPTL